MEREVNLVDTQDKIKNGLDSHDFKLVRTLVRSLNNADLSEILDEIDIEKAIVFFRLLPKPNRPEIFSYLSFDRQNDLLDHLPDIVCVSLLNEMEPVDRTKLLEELPEEISSILIQKLSPEERKIAWQLLSYPDDSVGRIMSPEFVALKSGFNVREALDYIKWNSSRIPEQLLHHIFVIDDENKFLGAISLAALVVADPSSLPIEEIMDTTVTPIEVTDDESLAVDFFRKYDKPYIPVIDDKNVLVGIVEVDDVFDVAEEEATEDIQQFGGSDALEDSYFQTPIHTLVRKRAGWLAILFVGMMFTTNALEHYDAFIKTMSFLVIFMPLIVSSGGNSGSQAASLIIRGFAVKEVMLSDWWRVFSREIVIGIGLGLILGAMGFLRVVIGGHEHLIGITVALALIGVVSFGTIVGSMLPFALKAIKLDPAVSSSPVIASVVDIVGIVIFFNIGIYVLGHWG